MKVNKFSRMYLVGMICILLSGFFPYFRYRFTIPGCRNFEAGVSFIESEKAGNTI